MSAKDKLKEIIKRAESSEKWFVEGYAGIKVLKGREAQQWLADIQAYIMDLEKNELTNSITNIIDNFDGWTDERKFDRLIAELKALYSHMEKKNLKISEAKLIAFCNELFNFYNIKVINNYSDKDYDFVIESDAKIYNIEVKSYRSSIADISMIRRAAYQLKSYKLNNSTNLILLIFSVINLDIKEKIKKEFAVEIIDIENLLYLVNNNEYLSRELRAIINDSIIDPINISPKELEESNQLFNIVDTLKEEKIEQELIEAKEAESLIEEFKKIPTGNYYFKRYEHFCEKILRYLFYEYLGIWNLQNPTDDGLHIMDLICRINKGSEFWDILREEFHSRYIVFEFKNYEEEIEQNQIYTTEKYLYGNALRNVCIIISRKGASHNAKLAIAGVLRETGKLIIPLSDNDLIKMVEDKASGSFPDEYLITMLDNIMCHLPK